MKILIVTALLCAGAVQGAESVDVILHDGKIATHATACTAPLLGRAGTDTSSRSRRQFPLRRPTASTQVQVS